MNTKHTPTPWTVENEPNGMTFSIWSGDIEIAECQSKDQANLIVRVHNSQDNLVATLEGMIKMADIEAAHGSKSWANAAAFAKTIIAKAKGE